jgi:hypothetical protein
MHIKRFDSQTKKIPIEERHFHVIIGVQIMHYFI